jgi:protein O-mannosyl-transferase
VLGTLAALTWKQTQVWRSTATLWTYNCSKDPGSSFSQNGLGYVLLSEGHLDEAIPHFREAIRIQSDNQKAHENLWIALDRKADWAGLLLAIENAKAVPHIQYQPVWRKANQLWNEGKTAESIPFFELAAKLRPNDAQVHTNYGLALARNGQRDLAEQQYHAAIQLDPNLFEARLNAALNYRALNRKQEAREYLEIALRLRPDHAGALEALRSLDGPANQQP